MHVCALRKFLKPKHAPHAHILCAHCTLSNLLFTRHQHDPSKHVGQTSLHAPVLSCRRRLIEVGGRQSSIRAQELNELQAVAVAQHLDAHPFAKAARSSRSTLVLSSYSFELLMHYLQGQKQWLLLSILNSHVRFEVGIFCDNGGLMLCLLVLHVAGGLLCGQCSGCC
jgi:hypothetical protein